MVGLLLFGSSPRVVILRYAQNDKINNMVVLLAWFVSQRNDNSLATNRREVRVFNVAFCLGWYG